MRTKEYYQDLYKQKLTTAEEIAKKIQSNDICAGPSALGEPQAIMDALAARAAKGEITGVEHHMLLAVRKWKYLEPEMAGKIKHVSWFTSANARAAVSEGRADYLPNYYYEVPRLWTEFVKPNVAYAMVSPMDAHGYFSFGVGASEPRSQMERADKVFIEVNPNMPRVHGNNFVHISEVDAICESNAPLPTMPPAELSEKDLKIGQFVAERIPNGACIQLGIGGMPNAVGKYLMDKKDLGLHTEMFTSSVIDLIEAGALNNSKKNIDRLKSVAAFSVGTKETYDYLNDNPAVEFHPVSYTNDPRVISQNDNMISINACVEVDLIGQVCSESVGPRNISGTGGQVDFVRGANWSKGGRAYICMYSTANIKGNTVSKITATLAQGAHVTTTKGDIDAIVTEYGVAELKGKTAAQRAKALIAIAHPDFRDQLLADAKKLNLMV